MSDVELVMLAGALLLLALIGFFAWIKYIQSKFDKDIYEILGLTNEEKRTKMTGHTKWEDLKHKRDSVVWTGSNVSDMEEFVIGSSFGFIVGSPFHNYRWWHRTFNLVFNKLPARVLPFDVFMKIPTPEWTPPEDMSVLEIFPERPEDYGDDSEDYTPWHWTTARPGDRIFKDGTVSRPDGAVIRPDDV
jgi:hypothetical protein